ncbi:MAG: hypothetical protein PHH47_07205 [Gallionella sp.]|nr:hypothetical protein [Gallionella sp.]MDD4947877.1 hypothetical protein [Gallionella sp.]
MTAVLSIHFDGPIVTEHKVSLRVMAKTYEHMQRAIDRAYLDTKYGSVWKHARLKREDYEHTEFLADYPREGGIILDGIKAGAEAIIDRINGAIAAPFEKAAQQGVEEHASIVDQLPTRRQYAHANKDMLATYQDMVDRPDTRVVRAYSDRSIVKEVDQIASMVKPDELDGSYVEFKLYGSRAHPVYTFDAAMAKRFHDVVSRRELGEPVLIRGRIRSLDQGNRYSPMKAKILNLDSHREITLHLGAEEDFIRLHPYHTAEQVFLFASPVIEFGAYDPNGGDMYFVDVAE